MCVEGLKWMLRTLVGHGGPDVSPPYPFQATTTHFKPSSPTQSPHNHFTSSLPISGHPHSCEVIHIHSRPFIAINAFNIHLRPFPPIGSPPRRSKNLHSSRPSVSILGHPQSYLAIHTYPTSITSLPVTGPPHPSRPSIPIPDVSHPP